MVALGDVAVVRAGGRLKLSGTDFVPIGIPAYGAGGLNGYLDTAEYVDEDAVILSSIGARCGKCFRVSGSWTSLANTQVILPRSDVADVQFMWHQLNDERTWHRSGSAQPFIKPSDVKSRRVWLPPLPEQRRIAAIMDAADAIRTKRRQALAHLDTLAQSVFHAMFGDLPATQRVGSIALRVRTGPFGSQLHHDEFVDEGVAVLGLDNVVGNEFRWVQRRFITSEKYESLTRYTVSPGDVLISIMGTTGRCVVVPDDIPVAINTKHICAITTDHDEVDPTYLRAVFLWHGEARRHLTQQTKGSIMAGLNMSIIKTMPIPVPSIDRQREFAARVDRINAHRTVLQRALATDDELFASLQSRAFKGEL